MTFSTWMLTLYMNSSIYNPQANELYEGDGQDDVIFLDKKEETSNNPDTEQTDTEGDDLSDNGGMEEGNNKGTNEDNDINKVDNSESEQNDNKNEKTETQGNEDSNKEVKTDETDSQEDKDKVESDKNKTKDKNKDKNKDKKDDKIQEKDKKQSGKKVYLTFDDGPSKFTPELLDILKEYDVKVTFFVIGKTDEHSLNMYKRIVEEGHTLAMHSYSHNYAQIYKSVKAFEKDFTKIRNLLYDTTGYMPNLYRFPGGSLNVVAKGKIQQFIKFLKKEKVVYFDWNVVNGDGMSNSVTKEMSYESVISGIGERKVSVVLMHDTDRKEGTIKSVEDIIKTLIDDGYSLLPLDNTVEPIQQVKGKK